MQYFVQHITRIIKKVITGISDTKKKERSVSLIHYKAGINKEYLHVSQI